MDPTVFSEGFVGSISKVQQCTSWRMLRVIRLVSVRRSIKRCSLLTETVHDVALSAWHDTLQWQPISRPNAPRSSLLSSR